MSPHSADPEDKPDAPDVLQENPAPLSSGAMIRHAREACEMSLADLATHTRIRRQTLEALERDDFAALQEPVYVRGYYRKIARVLKLDEIPLIAAYEKQENPQEPMLPARLHLASGTELGSGSRLPTAMASLLAVLAIVISGFLWLSRPQPEAVVLPGIFQPAGGGEAVPDAPSDALGDTPAAAEDTNPQSAETLPVTDMTEAQTTTPADALQLSFREDCWVRIDDANGKTLINELRHAGQDAVLSGALPLNVFLGNAPGVTMMFNGQPVDSAPYTRENNTARLRLPPEAAAP